MAKTVVGFYDDLAHARNAAQDLVDSGFDRDRVGLIANASAEDYSHYFDTEGRYRADAHDEELHTGRVPDRDLTTGEGAASGAGIGGIIGGLGGLLMGLGLLAVPGVGPALAAGPIASALVGAAIGAAAGGLAGALVNAGVPEERAGYYAEGVRRGGSLVTVEADDARANEAADILNRHSPVDIDKRASEWRESGWREHDPEAEPYTAEQIREERDRGGAERISVVDDDTTHYEDEATRYDFDADRDYYEEHHRTTYEDTGYTYTDVEPAYRYGTGLALNPTYEGREWMDVEPEARRVWEEEHAHRGSWDEHRDAVRYGYDRVRTGIV